MTRRLIPAACLLGLALPAAFAQVSAEISLEEGEHVLYAPINLRVKLTNHTAQPLDLQRMAGEEPWLGFAVTNLDGDEVSPTDVQWGPPKITLLPGQVRTVSANLTPLFELRDSGQYRVAARVTLGGRTRSTRPLRFTIVRGAAIWEKKFSAPPAPGSASRAMRNRLYSLIVHRGEQGQVLYARILDPEAQLSYCTSAVGPVTDFGQPLARVDLRGDFHIFHQSGTRIFTYTCFSAQGKRLETRFFANLTSNPEMVVSEAGDTDIIGGEEIVPDREGNEMTRPAPPRAPKEPPPDDE